MKQAIKQFLPVAAVLGLLLFSAPVRSKAANHHNTVTITYVNGTVTVSPQVIRPKLGDTVEFWAPYGEFALTFVNPFNDNGWQVSSTSGRWVSPPVEYGGKYHVECLLLINGQAINAVYGGDIEPDTGGTPTK